MNADIQVKGLNQLLQTLKTLPEKIEKNAVTAGMRAASKVVTDAAKEEFDRQWGPGKRYNPDSKDKDTRMFLGSIRRNIMSVRRRGKPGQVHFSIGVRTSRITQSASGKKKVSTGSANWRWLEFGTGQRWRKVKETPEKKQHLQRITNLGLKKGYTGAMPARPFMRPAFDKNKEKIIRAFASRIQEYIRGKIL